MIWVQLSNFKVELDTLLEHKKSNNELNLPQVSAKLSITAFFESYTTSMVEFIEKANCPLM